MARPFKTGLALLLVLSTVPASRADAQSLGDAARKAQEGRRNPPAATLVFDERDLDPEAAQQELLEFVITDARWQRYLAADRRVGPALQRDPAVIARLKGLQATSVLALERFLKREPVLLAALNDAGADAHEYAFTQLAAGTALAVQKRPDAHRVLEDLPEAVAANVRFVKAREGDVRALTVPTEMLAVRIATLPSGPPVSREAAVAAASVGASTAPVATTGVPVPDFAFVDFNGGHRRLSDYRGRYVLLDFWGVWCPNCRAEVPYLKDAYARFQSRGLEIIGMDYERGATHEDVRQYLFVNGVNWTFARADSVRDIIRHQFQIQAYPTLMLVDPNGGLVDTSSSSLRGARLAKTLDKLLPK
jgi:thiol-disulfide isomerase/thioredoxin